MFKKALTLLFVLGLFTPLARGQNLLSNGDLSQALSRLGTHTEPLPQSQLLRLMFMPGHMQSKFPGAVMAFRLILPD